jgi:hypothetical protein
MPLSLRSLSSYFTFLFSYNEAIAQGASVLASQLLAEVSSSDDCSLLLILFRFQIPNQLISYMESHKIVPKSLHP